MTKEALIIGAAIVLAAIIKEAFEYAKLRLGKYSISVQGQTEANEMIGISFPLFGDESSEENKAKIAGAYKIREARLEVQNLRNLEMQKVHQEGLKKVQEDRLAKIKAANAAQAQVKDATTA